MYNPMYNQGLHRLLAAIMMVAVSFPLIAPLLSAQAEAKLPACCRRDGKHGCAMAEDASPSSGGVAVKSRKTTCQQFSTGKATPAVERAHAAAPMAVSTTLASNSVLIAAEMKVRRKIAFYRSSQKRGPPSFQA